MNMCSLDKNHDIFLCVRWLKALVLSSCYHHMVGTWPVEVSGSRIRLLFDQEWHRVVKDQGISEPWVIFS